jgi:hypothetical protein
LACPSGLIWRVLRGFFRLLAAYRLPAGKLASIIPNFKQKSTKKTAKNCQNFGRSFSY